MKPTLLVLAAGMGSRYGGLKQLDEVGPSGETILEYSIYDAIQAGFGKIIFVIRESFESAFKERFGQLFEGKIDIEYAFQQINVSVSDIDIPERKKPWGTAHAVLAARHLINEPFAVVNADDYYGVSAFRSIADFLIKETTPTHYSMVGYVLKNTLSKNGSVSRGVCKKDNDGFLVNITERKNIEEVEGQIYYKEEGLQYPLADDTVVSMNLFGFHQNIFDIIEQQFIDFVKANYTNLTAEFYIPLVISNLVAAESMKMTVLSSNDQWFGVTYKEDKEEVQLALQELTGEGIYGTPLW